MRPTLLFDLDSITVEMTSAWLSKYYSITNDFIDEQKALTWSFRSLAKYPNVLDDILEEPGFFYHLEPIKNSIIYIDKLLSKDVEINFLTQPPRKADFACRDKKKWVLKHFPGFDPANLIFAHKKYKVFGDLLFDDNPDQLESWYEFGLINDVNGSKRIRSTINYSYNVNCTSEWRFDKDTAWEQFYNKVCDYYNLK